MTKADYLFILNGLGNYSLIFKILFVMILITLLLVQQSITLHN